MGGRAASWLLVTCALGLATLMFVPVVLGYQRYVITGDSMSGTFDRGSIVYSEAVPVAELEVGDVITYAPPRGKAPAGHLVTHRIASIDERDGTRVFRTKGDANANADPWQFRLERPTQARAAFGVPVVGFAFAALAIKQLRLLLIGLPALAIALALLARLWRQAGEEARRGGIPATAAARPDAVG